MKKIFPLLGALLMMVCACDKIEESEYLLYAGTPITWSDGNGVSNPVQRAFVEKYTGPKCINCPNADRTLTAAHEAYGDQLVLVSINHPVGQGEPYNNQPDMRTKDGNAWDEYFGINLLPSALLNRNTDASGSWVMYTSSMSNIVTDIDNIVNQTPAVALDINASQQGGKVNISFDLEFLEQVSAPLNITLAVVEDSLVYWQLDAAAGGLDQNYVHNHMLRDVITDVWGNPVEAKGNAGEQRQGAAEYKWNADWNIENCHIIAFISNRENKQILNSASCKIN